MLPIVLNEHQVCLFNFYLNEMIHQGMRYQTSLYGLIQTFKVDQRESAYDLACNLAQNSAAVVITIAQNKYSIWLALSATEPLGGKATEFVERQKAS